MDDNTKHISTTIRNLLEYNLQSVERDPRLPPTNISAQDEVKAIDLLEGKFKKVALDITDLIPLERPYMREQFATKIWEAFVIGMAAFGKHAVPANIMADYINGKLRQTPFDHLKKR